MTTPVPTHSAGLLRIALALIAWAQVGGELTLARARDVVDVGLSVVFFASSLAMLIGWHGRVATIVTGSTLVAIYHHLGLGHGVEDLRRHQSWLLAVAMLWLSASPCSRSLSWDGWRHRPQQLGSPWGLRLIGLQLSVVYLFGAIHKTDPAFWSGARLEQIFAAHYYGADIPAWVSTVSAPVAIAVTGLEYALAVGLWLPRARPVLMTAGMAMHLGFHLALPVGTFSVLSVVLYLAYLDPELVAKRLADAV